MTLRAAFGPPGLTMEIDMKIRMLVSLAGGDFVLSPGDETDRFGDAEAGRLVEAGYAVPVRDAEDAETATRDPAPETTTKPRVRKPRG